MDTRTASLSAALHFDLALPPRPPLAHGLRRPQPDGTKLSPPDTLIYHPVATLTMEVKFENRYHFRYGDASSDKGPLGGLQCTPDFFNAWDQQKLTALVESCINAYPFT